MKVLIADKFEKSGIDGLRAAGCDGRQRSRSQGRRAARGDREDGGRRAGGAQHEGDGADARRRTAVAHRARRRRLQHHRCGRGVRAWHLRLELSRQERDCRRGARLRADPGAGSPRSGQRRRAARRAVEQEGVLEGAGPLRQDPRPARRRQHRPGNDPPRRRVRPRRRAVEPAFRGGAAAADRAGSA